MKFMNMKRFGAIALAGVMAMSLTIPAFAADAPAAKNTVNITGKYEEIPISVVVPTTGNAQINPYGLPVTITKSDGKTVSLVGQQITTAPLSIKNQGDVALDVDASLLVTPTGDVSIAAAKTAGKTIAVSLEVAGLNDATLAVASDSEKLEDLLIDMYANDETWEEAATLAAPAYAKGGSAPAAAKSGSAMAVLGAVTTKSEGFNYGANSIALFRLVGDLAVEPNDGASPAVDTPWAAADGFTATVVFKFTPHVAIPASLSLSGNAVTSGTLTIANSGSASAEQVKVTFAAGESGRTVKSYAWTAGDSNVTLTAGENTDTVTVQGVTTNSTSTIKVVVTLDDDSTLEATCNITVGDGT